MSREYHRIRKEFWRMKQEEAIRAEQLLACNMLWNDNKMRGFDYGKDRSL